MNTNDNPSFTPFGELAQSGHVPPMPNGCTCYAAAPSIPVFRKEGHHLEWCPVAMAALKSDMKTPSNAGKEHNPDSLTPEQYGAPEWRLLTKGETIKQGDEYWCADWFDSVTTGVATTYMTAFTYRRRTTPPTKSQEGETPETDDAEFDSADENLMVVTSEFARLLERRLTAAQRENDRLRSALSKIAELNGDGDAQQFKLTRFQAAQIARKALSDAARAATEEGERG